MTIDIVIPVYGGQAHLQRLIPALADTTQGMDVKVWFSDDATPPEKGGDELRDWLTEECRVREGWTLLASPVNGGFSASNNRAASVAKGKYLCMLNSDTVPFKGWLSELKAVLDALPQVGAVGAKLIWPPWSPGAGEARFPGKIQHAGVVFNAARMPYHIYAKWDPKDPRVNRPVMMKAVTGACMLVRRSVWDRVGGLDEAFGQGNFEDIDLCLKIGEAGFEIAYCPTAELYHVGSGSDNVEAAERNAHLFIHRWQGKIVSDDWMYL